MTVSPGRPPGRILIIVENLPVPFDRRVWMESTTLARAGYQVCVICPTGKGCESLREDLDGIHIYRHRLPPEKSSALGYLREYSSALWAEWRLARKVRRDFGFDVIHACNPPDLIFLVVLWFKLFHRTKFVFDHHDLTPELYESKFNKRGFFYQMMRLAERLTFALADRVISTNESYKQVAIDRGRKKPENVQVVRSGPDLSRFNPIAPDERYKNGRKWLVGYMGVMGEFDGVDHLVRAAGYLIKDRGRDDIHFCFIGGGSCLEDLKQLAAGLGIESQTEFTGRVPDEEMIARLSSCDVCVDCDPLNPLNDKSTMNKILEYMALGRPIVQYDLLEGRRSAGDASLYARPNDVEDLAAKILELLTDEARRKEMGETGRRRMVNELEWRHQAPRLLNFYSQLI
ncbi:MAG: glycosyltransferase family 4 protein [Kiritimatiellia bacterium]